MDEESFFNPNLKSRLLKLEEEFKKNNPLGYQQRSTFTKNIFNKVDFIFHEMLSCDATIHFIIDISKHKWRLISAKKNIFYNFHANDVTRLQYIEAAEQGNFMGYLPKYVMLCYISNQDTLEKINPISNEDLAKVFLTTIHGKRIKHLFNDFGLTIKNINFKKENDGNWNKRNIIIDTDILPD